MTSELQHLNEKLEALQESYDADMNAAGNLQQQSQFLADQVEMLEKENQRLRKSGNILALSAIRVVLNYDGVHRLSLAIAHWFETKAGEHGRPH